VTRLFTNLSNKEIEYIVVPSTLNIPRQSRPELAARMKASLFVEIHHDSVQRNLFDKLRKARSSERILDYYQGFCLLVFGDEKSVALAKAVEASMIQAGIKYSPYRHEDIRLHTRMTLIPGTRVTYRREKLFVLRTSDMPAIIVECGVTANPREELLLKRADYRKRIADAIHEGISNYLSLKDR
jgi:N-acetylmuramoyl-L-alanine amidase